MIAANDNGKTKAPKKKRGVADSALDYGRPIAWDAENDNEEPSDPDRYVALDGVRERRA